MSPLAVIAAGGAVGAVARYLVMVQVGHWLGAAFPFGTLAVNVIGSVVAALVGFMCGMLLLRLVLA